MKFIAEVDVMPQDALLDPQGKAVSQGLKTIGLSAITDVRVGRHILLKIETDNKDTAITLVEDACKKLLVNQVMEKYSYSLREV